MNLSRRIPARPNRNYIYFYDSGRPTLQMFLFCSQQLQRYGGAKHVPRNIKLMMTMTRTRRRRWRGRRRRWWRWRRQWSRWRRRWWRWRSMTTTTTMTIDDDATTTTTTMTIDDDDDDDDSLGFPRPLDQWARSDRSVLRQYNKVLFCIYRGILHRAVRLRCCEIWIWQFFYFCFKYYFKFSE